jgi:hypothetical protein
VVPPLQLSVEFCHPFVFGQVSGKKIVEPGLKHLFQEREIRMTPNKSRQLIDWTELGTMVYRCPNMLAKDLDHIPSA